MLQPVIYSVAVEQALDKKVVEGRLYYATTVGGFVDKPIVINDYEAWVKENDPTVGTVGESPKSLLQAPLLRQGKPFGRISLENMDRKDAFSDADIRLMNVLAIGGSIRTTAWGSTMRRITWV